MILSSLKQ
ncbi:hypothetical protein BDFB_015085 [Asbolus verrucosus]|uniref:Uncharacterized protein n=1 Tax=Asbolus verrucosus TaxID=1661398 RepID=A0A482VQ24_ASBVE|nr:hypothetical protein BDFB_011996 [Asbolus verrucosus]RZC34965.1 hypothetical protein BDFB_015085 [Asbolus verrucosus]